MRNEIRRNCHWSYWLDRGKRARSLPRCYAQFAQLLFCLFVSRPEPQCLLQVSNRFIPPALLRQHPAQVAMGFGIICVESERIAEMLDRLVNFSKPLQSDGQVVLRSGTFDRRVFEPESSRITGNRIFQATFAGKCVT